MTAWCDSANTWCLFNFLQKNILNHPLLESYLSLLGNPQGMSQSCVQYIIIECAPTQNSLHNLISLITPWLCSWWCWLRRKFPMDWHICASVWVCWSWLWIESAIRPLRCIPMYYTAPHKTNSRHKLPSLLKPNLYIVQACTCKISLSVGFEVGLTHMVPATWGI